MKCETSCPLSDVDRALRDAGELLAALNDSYFSPDQFRKNLNLALQTLRNVTFILQSNKAVMPDFDEWYRKWQDLMRADPILRWAVESRNHVVKQGDLETHSRARIAILDSYLKPSAIEFNVPPSGTPEEIALAVEDAIPPSDIRDVSIVKVERRWVDSELPDREIFNSLAYVFRCLSSVVASAHAQVAGSEGTAELPAHHDAAKSERTVYLKLKDLMFVYTESQAFKVSEESGQAAVEHYGIEFESQKDGSLIESARYYFDVARRVFLKDGYHRTFAIIIGNEVRIVGFDPSDKANKFLIARDIATKVRELKGTSIMVIGEAWQAESKEPPSVVNVESIPSRREILLLQAATSGGDVVVLEAPILRANGSVALGETEETTGTVETIGPIGFLSPVFEEWGIP